MQVRRRRHTHALHTSQPSRLGPTAHLAWVRSARLWASGAPSAPVGRVRGVSGGAVSQSARGCGAHDCGGRTWCLPHSQMSHHVPERVIVHVLSHSTLLRGVHSLLGGRKSEGPHPGTARGFGYHSRRAPGACVRREARCRAPCCFSARRAWSRRDLRAPTAEAAHALLPSGHLYAGHLYAKRSAKTGRRTISAWLLAYVAADCRPFARLCHAEAHCTQQTDACGCVLRQAAQKGRGPSYPAGHTSSGNARAGEQKTGRVKMGAAPRRARAVSSGMGPDSQGAGTFMRGS